VIPTPIPPRNPQKSDIIVIEEAHELAIQPPPRNIPPMSAVYRGPSRLSTSPPNGIVNENTAIIIMYGSPLATDPTVKCASRGTRNTLQLYTVPRHILTINPKAR